VACPEPDLLVVEGLTAPEIAAAASGRQIPVYELTPARASLEQAYMELTRDSVQFREEVAA
jgi:ABC-2 type transport system ATP-binding protein